MSLFKNPLLLLSENRSTGNPFGISSIYGNPSFHPSTPFLLNVQRLKRNVFFVMYSL